MPSFFRKKQKSNNTEEEQGSSPTQPTSGAPSSKPEEKKAKEGTSDQCAPTPPPTYEARQERGQDSPPPFEAATVSQGGLASDQLAALTNSFAHLKLGTQRDPDVDTCIAHLRFIHAIQNLKEDVGYNNGLWDLWDNRAGPVGSIEDGELDQVQVADIKTKLSHLREKRWAIYIARAVDRYQIWWQAIAGERLLAKVVDDRQSPRWIDFPNGSEDFSWTENQLPPLDVLMIWHTHMLNPRCFLEDAMRWGLRELWTTGMPWGIVNKVLDPKMRYETSSECRTNWETLTGLTWKNEEGPRTRVMVCPACKHPNDVAWTSCGLPETYKGVNDPGLTGSGFGDGDFQHTCTECAMLITKEILSVVKVMSDVNEYIAQDITMPGSVLHPETGMPPEPAQVFETAVPNRVAKEALGNRVQDFVNSKIERVSSMLTVRDLISSSLLSEARASKLQESSDKTPQHASGSPSKRYEAVQIRKMMSRYWENHSIFALDLVAAVLRQGVFIEKMARLNWLFTPTLRQSMDRFCQKYQRFFLIMQENPMHLCVPTLDVDLVWHTHQLAPRAYYAFSTKHSAKMGLYKIKFVDHNDKVEETTLSRSFERTSASYLAKFGEVYAECACGYCEAIHHKNAFPRGANLFAIGKNKTQKAVHDFQNKNPPPSTANTAHISAHNAVEQPLSRAYIGEYLRKAWQVGLEDSYDKAVKRAAKRGRKLPSKGEYYNHWGRKYFMYGPQSPATYLSGTMYNGSSPAVMVSPDKDQGFASCASGSCGQNDIAAGGCGGPGGCVQWSNINMGTQPSATGGAGGAGCGGGGA